MNGWNYQLTMFGRGEVIIMETTMEGVLMGIKLADFRGTEGNSIPYALMTLSNPMTGDNIQFSFDRELAEKLLSDQEGFNKNYRMKTVKVSGILRQFKGEKKFKGDTIEVLK
jgi:hypothetical protein